MPAELRADCSRCFGLCCVVPAFAASADFAVSKPAGRPCRNLLADSRCGIHADLRERGFPGCTVYDCFGAGQRVAQETFGGRDWRTDAGTRAGMATAFPVVRDLHELLWYLAEAAERGSTSVRAEVRAVTRRVEAAAARDVDGLARVDVGGLHAATSAVLTKISGEIRAGMRGRDHLRADLVGKDLRRADLRGASLRGARLIGADLRGVDLDRADVVGADLRGARLAGARLGTVLFLSQFQVNSASGDARTELPARVDRPAHWA